MNKNRDKHTKHLLFLPETNSAARLHLKMDGWKTFSFPFGMVNFQGLLLLVFSGRVFLPENPLKIRSPL